MHKKNKKVNDRYANVIRLQHENQRNDHRDNIIVSLKSSSIEHN